MLKFAVDFLAKDSIDTSVESVLIDDIRNMDVDIICRNSRAGLRVLKELNGDFEILYIDHDLGDHDQMNGYQIIETAIYFDWLPKTVQIVSMNPVGRENISRALLNSGFKTIVGQPNKFWKN